VLIGGLAVQTHRAHGHVRTTSIADLIPAPDPANLERLAAALRSLGARVLNPVRRTRRSTRRCSPRAMIWQFIARDSGIDVMHEVPGGRSYADLGDRALHVQLGDIEVPVVGLDDLIQRSSPEPSDRPRRRGLPDRSRRGAVTSASRPTTTSELILRRIPS
jgi:hypothetical protein